MQPEECCLKCHKYFSLFQLQQHIECEELSNEGEAEASGYTFADIYLCMCLLFGQLHRHNHHNIYGEDFDSLVSCMIFYVFG